MDRTERMDRTDRTRRTGWRDHYEQRRCTSINIDLLRGRTGQIGHTGDRTGKMMGDILLLK